MDELEEKNPIEGTPPAGEAMEKFADGNDGLEWNVMPDVAAVQKDARGGTPISRRLGVTWTHLTVEGVNAAASFNENVCFQFMPSFAKKGVANASKSAKTTTDSSHGCVKPGEMLLELGR